MMMRLVLPVCLVMMWMVFLMGLVIMMGLMMMILLMILTMMLIISVFPPSLCFNLIYIEILCTLYISSSKLWSRLKKFNR